MDSHYISSPESTIFWFRRDLRINDNVGLTEALRSGKKVIPLFIFDNYILEDLNKDDKRISFMYDQLTVLNIKLMEYGSSLWVYRGNPEDFFQKSNVHTVYTNSDYEPYGIKRDEQIADILKSKNIPLHTFKDHVIFEKDDIVKNDGTPYQVYTPYCKKWKEKLQNTSLSVMMPDVRQFSKGKSNPFPTLAEMGFNSVDYKVPFLKLSNSFLENYEQDRDFPAKEGTTNLSIFLRFGAISIRKVVQIAFEHNIKLLDELIWREFYSMILWFFPKTITENFRKEFDLVAWDNNEQNFELWKQGKTGYPMVDAGMRELSNTGFMHNRVRMVCASFLTKHLLTHWTYGENWFAQNLLDYELASNVGNWQWAAGTGCDAAPYFRVFNPEIQQQKFDPKFEYIKKWVPEYGSSAYPKPIVDHSSARKRAIEAFEKAKKQSS